MKHSQNIEMLSIVAKGLGGLKERVVFLGGATVGLHLTSPEAPEERPTDDVDCVVEITSLANYYNPHSAYRGQGSSEFLRQSLIRPSLV